MYFIYYHHFRVSFHKFELHTVPQAKKKKTLSIGQSVEKDVFLKCFENVNRKYQCSDFEVYLCDLHEDVNLTNTTLWKGDKPCLLGSEGHDQAANCLSAISSEYL